MFAVMLIAAVFFAWFGWRLQKSHRQAAAIAVLQQVGAVYGYDYQGPIARPANRWGKLAPAAGRSHYPRWLHEWLGVDFLHNVTRVHLETSYRLSAADVDRLWSALGDLPDLVYLEASGPVTRPGAIQRLQRARHLQRLALRWADIADEDLAILARMPRLEELNLNETPVTDAAMAYVARAPNLQAIELHHTKITDAGLMNVAKLKQLRRLRLSATDVADEGLRHLAGLEHLNELDLEHTKITDRGVVHVASLSHLERLNLSLNAITEDEFPRLASLLCLKQLNIQLTPIGPSALATLPKLPALESVQLTGPIVSGDLSPLSQCRKLRVLTIPVGEQDPVRNGLKLPPSLEEISGLRLIDATLFDQLASLPNLKVIHAHATYASMYQEEMDAVNRFRTARPDVQVLNR
jgi:hypothetical protein